MLCPVVLRPMVRARTLASAANSPPVARAAIASALAIAAVRSQLLLDMDRQLHLGVDRAADLHGAFLLEGDLGAGAGGLDLGVELLRLRRGEHVVGHVVVVLE